MEEGTGHLEPQSVDGQLIFSSARDRLVRLFEAEARDAGLLPRKQIREMPHQVPVEGPSGSDLIDSADGRRSSS